MKSRIVAVWFAAFLSSASVRAELRPHSIDKPLTLSDAVRVVLTIEGPAPLRVEMPLRPNRDPAEELLLTADTDAAWGYVALPGAGPVISPLPDRRERWQKVYSLTPFVPGMPLRAVFNPVTVITKNPTITAFIEIDGQQLPAAVSVASDQESVTVTWPTVEAMVQGPPGDLVIARRTDVENPPEPAVVSGTDPTALVLWTAGAGILGFLAIAVLVRLRGRHRKVVPADEWALRALSEVESSVGQNSDRAARLAEVLREFIQRWFGIPAKRLTTSELLSAGEQQGWPVEQADALRILLDEADRAKFAGVVPDDDRLRRLNRQAIDWVNDVCRRAEPG